MNKKSISILLLGLLPCFSMIRTAACEVSYSQIHGFLGKNLEVNVWLTLNGYREIYFVANNTITVSILVTNYMELYVKNLQVELNLEFGSQNFNITVVRNSTLPLTAGNIRGLQREFNFTPKLGGFLQISVNADYTYVQGNQTLEQVSMMEGSVTDVFWPGRSYDDISSQNYDLQNEVKTLNTSYQNVNSSYQRSTPILTTAIGIFIGTTILVFVWGEIRFRRLKKSSTWVDEKMRSLGHS